MTTSNQWTRVLIESPYSGDVERNVEYLNRAILDCIRRNESPYASHRMLTDALDDGLPEERDRGIDAGMEYLKVTEKTVVYNDYGISGGMAFGIAKAKTLEGRAVEERSIGPNPPIPLNRLVICSCMYAIDPARRVRSIRIPSPHCLSHRK